MKLKKIATILTLATIIQVVPAINATATQHNNDVNVKISQQQSEDYSKLIEKFDLEGIDKSTQKTLLDKLDAGELWDSLKSGSVPVKEEKGVDLDGSPYIKKTFEDGSIVKVLDHSMNGRQLNVNYGNVASSSLYHTEYIGGKVGVDLMLVNFGMKVDWTWNRYNLSVIKRVYSPWATNLSSRGDITITVQPNTTTRTMQVKVKSPLGQTAYHNLTAYLKSNSTLDGIHEY